MDRDEFGLWLFRLTVFLLVIVALVSFADGVVRLAQLLAELGAVNIQLQ